MSRPPPNALRTSNISQATTRSGRSSASSGNLVEWFDFYIYAFTALYFSSAFFPGDNPTAYDVPGVYALVLRDRRQLIFGRLADRAGRRHSMVIAVLMMSFDR